MVKEALETFARWIGQLLNPAKCSIMFNEHHTMPQDQLKHVLQVQLSSFEAKYLAPHPFWMYQKKGFSHSRNNLVKGLQIILKSACQLEQRKC